MQRKKFGPWLRDDDDDDDDDDNDDDDDDDDDDDYYYYYYYYYYIRLSPSMLLHRKNGIFENSQFA